MKKCKINCNLVYCMFLLCYSVKDSFQTGCENVHNCSCKNTSATCLFILDHSAVAKALETLPDTIKTLNLTISDGWRGLYPLPMEPINLTALQRFSNLETLNIIPPHDEEPAFARKTSLTYENYTSMTFPNLKGARINIPLFDQDLSGIFSRITSLEILDLRWINALSFRNLQKLLSSLNKEQLKVVNISNFQSNGQPGYSTALNLAALFNSTQTNITVLDISWNSLTMLAHGISTVAPHLTYLDISHNLLTNNQVTPFLLEVALMNVSTIISRVQGSQELNPLPRIPEFSNKSNELQYFFSIKKCIDRLASNNFTNMILNHTLFIRAISVCFSEDDFHFPAHLVPPFEEIIDSDCQAYMRNPLFRYVKYVDISYSYLDIQSHLGMTLSGKVCMWPNSRLETVKFSNNQNIIVSSLMASTLQNITKIEGMEKCKEIDFSGNNATFYIQNLVSSFPALAKLNFSNNAIRLHEHYSICTDNPKLEVIDFSRNRLQTIPDMIVKHCEFLSYFILSGNDIKETLFFEIPLFSHTQEIHIDLQSNKISFLNERFTKELDKHNRNQVFIDLRKNPFECNCNSDSRHFIQWVNKRHAILKDVQSYLCTVDRRNYKVKELALQQEMARNCDFNKFQIMIYTVFSTVFVFFLIIIIYIVYRKRWKIRYFLFMRLLRGKQNRNKVTRKKYEYDAFVSYSAEDRFWVHGVLMKELESVYGFRLCIHYRDFAVGTDILKEITGKMNQSREIVVVLSETSVDKYWCEQELKISIALTKQRKQNLIVIKLGNIGPEVDNITANHVLQHQNYLEWTDEMDNEVARQKLFWARIVAFMYGTQIGNTCFSCWTYSPETLGDALDSN